MRKQLAENLHGSFVVFRDKVQEDLKLTDEQKEKLDQHLKELLPDAMQIFQKLGGLKGEEREKEHKAFRQKVQAKLAAVLKETLKEGQRKRCASWSCNGRGLRPVAWGRSDRERPEDHGRATEAIHGCGSGHAKEDRTPDQRGRVGRRSAGDSAEDR